MIIEAENDDPKSLRLNELQAMFNETIFLSDEL